MAPTTPPLRAALLRHAPTEWNREGRIQGHQDSPLTLAGRRLAEIWARRLTGVVFQRVAVSDLGRARETAAVLNPGGALPLTTDPRLREQDWGAWTGLRLSAIRRQFPRELAQQEAQGWGFRPPGGESRREVVARGQAALVDMAARWPGEHILVVTHEGFLKCLLYHLLHQGPQPVPPPRVRPHHLHWVAVAGGRLRLEHLNALNLVPTGETCPPAGPPPGGGPDTP